MKWNLLRSALFSICVFGVVSSVYGSTTLKDIDSSLYKESIYFLQGESVIQGYDDGTFRPDQTINRAEFLKILIGARYERELNQRNYNTLCFDDITDRNAWYVPYVCFAQDWGIIRGYEGNVFRPDQNINLVEAAKIISKVYGDDVSEDKDIWYRPYMEFLLDNNLVPLQVTAFDHFLTRAEMAEMVARAQKRDVGQLDDYLVYREQSYKENFFPSFETFGQTESVEPETVLEDVSNETTSNGSGLLRVVESEHPGKRISGGYISDYHQWTPAQYEASIENNALPVDRIRSLSEELLGLLNQERQANGKPVFTVDDTLTSMTQDFADHLVINAFYSHSDKYGNDPFERAAAAGVSGFVAESMVWRSGGPSNAVGWWKKSSLHWNNIMNERFNRIGIGISQEPNGGYIIIILKGE